MKRCFLTLGFAVFLLLVANPSAFAGMPIKQGGNFGIGLGAGTTAAPLSLKYFLDSSTSLQGNVGWWRGGFLGCAGRFYDGRRRGRRYCGYYNDALGLGGDFLYEGGPLAGNADVTLDWEIGGGVGIGLSEFDFGFAAAFVVGLQVNIHAVPLDIVLEYRPNVYFIPFFRFNPVDFTPHVRYYF